MQGRPGTEIQNAINELRARKLGAGGSGTGTPPSGIGPVVPAQPSARPGATQPTPRDGMIGGKPEPIPTHASKGEQEGIRLETESEDAMAAAGYHVERRPAVRPDERLTLEEERTLGRKGLDPLGRVGSDKNPDDRMGGNLTDMVAPASPDLDQVRKALSRKVRSRQAYRLVLDLGRTGVVREQVEALLRRNPGAGLQELFIIERDRAISRVFPDPEQIVPAPKGR